MKKAGKPTVWKSFFGFGEIYIKRQTPDILKRYSKVIQSKYYQNSIVLRCWITQILRLQDVYKFVSFCISSNVPVSE